MTLRQLGRKLWQRTAVRLRLPGAVHVGPTRLARNGPVALAYDIRGRGSPLVLIHGVGVGRWGWSRWPIGWAAAELVSDCLDAPVTEHPCPSGG